MSIEPPVSQNTPHFRAQLRPIEQLRRTVGKWSWRPAICPEREAAELMLLTGTAGTPAPNKHVRRAGCVGCVGCAGRNYRRAAGNRCRDGIRPAGAVTEKGGETCAKNREWTEKPGSGRQEKTGRSAMREAPARTMQSSSCAKGALRQGLVRRVSKRKKSFVKRQSGVRRCDTICSRCCLGHHSAARFHYRLPRSQSQWPSKPVCVFPQEGRGLQRPNKCCRDHFMWPSNDRTFPHGNMTGMAASYKKNCTALHEAVGANRTAPYVRPSGL